MIRRSTFIFLTCLAAFSVPAMRPQGAALALLPQASVGDINQPVASQMLMAQAADSPTASSPTSSSLAFGARGEAVKALQIRLQSSNYYSGPIDGVYGIATQRAVSAFQAETGLEETGSLNDETWEQLQALSDENASTSAETAALAETEQALANPATEPTASELPPTTNQNEATEVAAVPDDSQGNLGKILGLSLGIIALVASFGVGFFMANKGKSEADDEALGEEPLNAFGTPIGASNGTGKGSSKGSAAHAPSKLAGVQNVSVHAATPGSVGSSTAVTTTLNSVPTSGQMGDTSALTSADVIDGLIGDLHSPDPTCRRRAIWELGQRGNSLAMKPLVDAMTDADSKEKSLVLAALSEIGIRSLKPMSRALAIALQDENPEVRKNAIRDLTRVYDLVVQISQMLGHATEDEDPEVRQTATWALDQLNRIRRSQDIDANMRSFAGTASTAAPIDLLSSEASLRRSSQQ
ncbi:MAG: hypothetical protein HC800_05180 [Phormidesmis sp. RL_2_1]|nr:hypothetical protein [Phormidesmis sp. RL_2_1]